jgi:hypothetical protein
MMYDDTFDFMECSMIHQMVMSEFAAMEPWSPNPAAEGYTQVTNFAQVHSLLLCGSVDHCPDLHFGPVRDWI